MSLHHSYLSPLGCHALLSLPIIVHGESPAPSGWRIAPNALSGQSRWKFAHAIANLLAMRAASGHTVAVTTTRSQPAADTARRLDCIADTTSARTGTGARRHRPGLGARRAAAFMTRLAGHADIVGGAGAEVIDRLAIMSLRFTDATALAETLSGDNNGVISYLIRELGAPRQS